MGLGVIPKALISRGAKLLPQRLGEAAGNPLQFHEAVAALRRYSLIEVGDGTWSVHRLVQAVIRDRLGKADQKQWAEAAVRLVNKAFPYEKDEVRTWGECARLLPQALAVAGHAEELQVGWEAAGRLLNQAGLYLKGRAEFTAARALSERALAIGEETFGSNHPQVAIYVNNLGRVLHDLGDLPGARAALERALKIRQESLGEEHPKTITVRRNLAAFKLAEEKKG